MRQSHSYSKSNLYVHDVLCCLLRFGSTLVSSASRLHLVPRIPKQKLVRGGGCEKNNPSFFGISYNSACDELFLADEGKHPVVRAMPLRVKACDLHDMYRNQHQKESVSSVCT